MHYLKIMPTLHFRSLVPRVHHQRSFLVNEATFQTFFKQGVILAMVGRDFALLMCSTDVLKLPY